MPDVAARRAGRGGAILYSILSAVLPPGVQLSQLTLGQCSICEHAFGGCGPLVAELPKLSLLGVMETLHGTDVALQAALGALIALTPHVRHLTIDADSEGGGAEQWAEAADGQCLSCGLPPAVTALRHLQMLQVCNARLPSLPGGPYLAGELQLESTSFEPTWLHA